MTPPASGVDMIDVIVRTRSGAFSATVCTIMPPIDAPTMSAWSTPYASSTATASAAMSAIVYGSFSKSKHVVWPTSRLSYRMTCSRQPPGVDELVGPQDRLSAGPHHQQDRRIGRIPEVLGPDLNTVRFYHSLGHPVPPHHSDRLSVPEHCTSPPSCGPAAVQGFVIGVPWKWTNCQRPSPERARGSSDAAHPSPRIGPFPWRWNDPSRSRYRRRRAR